LVPLSYVLIDPVLEEKGFDKLKGEVAISLAKTACQIYENSFQFGRLKDLIGEEGNHKSFSRQAPVPKTLLSAMAKYVEALIGANTISTLPMEIIETFRDHGNVESRLEKDLPYADRVLLQLQSNGIS
jgi:transaldolase